MEIEKKPRLLTKNFLFIFIVDFLFATGFGLLFAVIPLWMSDTFKADSSSIGLILGLSGLSTLIFRPFMGFAIDRWGRKNILHLALGLFTILNFSLIFAHSLWAIFIIRFIQCIPFAAITTCNVTIATDSMPAERRGEGYCYFTAAATFPMAIGPAIGLALYKVDWFWPFVVAGLVALFCFVFSLFMKIPFYTPIFRKLSLKSLFKKELIFITLISAIGGSVLPGVMSFLSLYIKEIPLNLDFIGLILLCYALSLFIVRAFGAKFINQTNPKILGCIALTLLGAGSFVMGVRHEIIGIAIGAVLIGIGSGIMLPTFLTMAARIAPENRGVSTSMVFAGSDIAQSAGSYLFGSTAKLIGTYGNAYIAFSGFEIIGIIVFLLLTIPHYEKDRQNKMSLPDYNIVETP